jgi:hypothetical protein
MKITFRQFLVEGGAATAAYNTQRANKTDIEKAIAFVCRATGIKREVIMANLLGSTSHTLLGKKADSGDVDIAFQEDKYDRDTLAERMKKATGMSDVKQIGSGTFSFAVPVSDTKRIQVDFMFVASEQWAKFGFHSALDSKHKGLVRNNFLLDNVMKHTFEPGKDLRITDKEGNDVVRVRRTFGRAEGLYRSFKAAPMRKDGKGRVQLKKVTPEQVEQVLRELGHKSTFSKDAEPILSPDQAAEFLFGKGTRAADIMSAEQVIKAIFKRKDHAAIFKDAAADFVKAGMEVPAEIAKFA